MDKSKQSPDCVVIGAGIFGLWAARHALKAGERVLVLEKRAVGAGASGGFLGSLMPHMPDRWNTKKQMQYEGLRSIGEAIGELEEDTGLLCGFRRCGRLMPLAHERMLAHVQERIEGAKRYWVDERGQQAFTMEHVSPEEAVRRFKTLDGSSWLSEEAMPFGAQYDTLSARVRPRDYLHSLAHYAHSHERGQIVEGAGVVDVRQEGDAVEVLLEGGESLAAGRSVIANGFEAYRLLARMGAVIQGQALTGRGVKGQAVEIWFVHEDDLPIIYDHGSYIVPHEHNQIAIGSTSVNDWLPEGVDPKSNAQTFDEARTGFDPDNMAFFDHGLHLCPALSRNDIVSEWANIRPRNTVRNIETGKVVADPIFGALEGQERISVAVGGFKISFGVGHMVGG